VPINDTNPGGGIYGVAEMLGAIRGHAAVECPALETAENACDSRSAGVACGCHRRAGFGDARDQGMVEATIIGIDCANDDAKVGLSRAVIGAAEVSYSSRASVPANGDNALREHPHCEGRNVAAFSLQ
jgi:hypothetical protein